MTITYGSLCSGIEGATVAWRGLGWRTGWFAEIDPFCKALLEYHHSGVKNYGDITKLRKPEKVALIIGGTPCPSFSKAGQRKGLADARGQLALEFCRIVGDVKPRWVVWENVQGVLSSNKGKDFRCFISELGNNGYTLCWRVLDSRFFGLPQTRKRVFVVGHLGENWRRPCEVLEVESGEKNIISLDEIQEETSFGVGEGELRGSAREKIEWCYGWTGDETPKISKEIALTLRAQHGGEGAGVWTPEGLRRFTITECERLMGFPDGYTDIEFNGKKAGESVRRRALGNSFPVPVIRWIGERIQAIEKLNNATPKGINYPIGSGKELTGKRKASREE